MGTAGSKINRKLNYYKARHDRKVIICGLGGAGKSTIFSFLTNRPRPDGPTKDPNVASIKFGKHRLHLWDLGGQDHLRPYWRHHYTACQGVLFVVDATDRANVVLAAEELQAMVVDEQLVDAVYAILVNKQDAPGAMNTEELTKLMDLKTIIGAKPFAVIGTVGKDGEGVNEALDFLTTNMKKL